MLLNFIAYFCENGKPCMQIANWPHLGQSVKMYGSEFPDGNQDTTAINTPINRQRIVPETETL